MPRLTPKSMKHTGLSGLFLFIVLFLAGSSAAQNFNYSVQVNTTSWSELSSQTLCNAVNQPWQPSYKIPIGFSFVFNGISYDSVTINTSGALVFDAFGNHAFSAYSGFSGKLDSANNHSVLGYTLSGTSGNQILKLQFKNIGQSASPYEYLSYQLWLYQSGRIDVIAGPNTYQPDPNDPQAVADSAQYILIGAHDMHMMAATRGYFVGVTASGIAGQASTEENPVPVFLNVVPASGTRFIFTPVSN